MRQVLPLLVFGIIAMVASAHAQDPGDFVGNQSTFTAARAWHARWSDFDNWPPSDDVDAFELAMTLFRRAMAERRFWQRLARLRCSGAE